MICRTSTSRPHTGSIFPSLAAWVRLTVYLSKAGVRLALGKPVSSPNDPPPLRLPSRDSLVVPTIAGTKLRMDSGGMSRKGGQEATAERRRLSSNIMEIGRASCRERAELLVGDGG